jgi:molecular chaperone GrpE
MPMSHPEDERGPETVAAKRTSSADDVASAEAQLAHARSVGEEERRKADAYLDLAQRAQADFANYKRRASQEIDQTIRDANAGLLTQLLPIFDDLQRALASVPDDVAEHSWAQGIALIGQKLEHILQQQGLERIGGEGDLFDPRVHEAVAYEKHLVHDEGQIASVYRAPATASTIASCARPSWSSRGGRSRAPASAGGESRSVGEGAAHS